MLIVLAATNVFLWSGVIVFMLFRVMRQQRGIDEQLREFEDQTDEPDPSAK